MSKWLTSTNLIRFSVADRVARITLNRPEKRNALSKELIRELHEALLEADDLVDVSVIVLEGEGKDFCSGYDLAGAYAGQADDAETAKYRKEKTVDNDMWSLERTQMRSLTMWDTHKPVIAKVHGNCLAGGTDIAFLCDMVVASEDARIGFPATRANGTPPNHMWVYHCGPQWAKRMLMTGDILSGRDAARIGLILDCAPVAQLEATVAELARRVSHVDAELLATHKRVVNHAMEMMGARMLQRFSAEWDAVAHLASGPMRTRFKKDMAEGGLKQALKNRDAAFGDSLIKMGW
jgi:enoyl-CoA hydratase